MPQDLVEEVTVFAKRYRSLWDTPRSSQSEYARELGELVASHYRPGFTFFTNGQIARFESQSAAAELITSEIQTTIARGLGAHLILREIKQIQIYSTTSALVHLCFDFRPLASGRWAGKDWSFTNIYGYRRDEDDPTRSGWEFVVRDEETKEMRKVTGDAFA